MNAKDKKFLIFFSGYISLKTGICTIKIFKYFCYIMVLYLLFKVMWKQDLSYSVSGALNFGQDIFFLWQVVTITAEAHSWSKC